MNTGTVLTYSVHNSTKLDQGRREGGGGQRGQIAPGPSLFCVLNISAQGTRYLGFFALSTEIWPKNEIKFLESSCNVLVRKIFLPLIWYTDRKFFGDGGGGGC